MRGRFAPSPTGPFHLGNLRTALLAWLFARSAGSEFLLRFEDLDDSVVRPEHYDVQRRDLERLGLDWDGEMRQRDHVDRYRAAIADLTERGLTYRCYCSRREIREAASAPHADLPDGGYPGTCRDLTEADHAAMAAEGRAAAVRLRADGVRMTSHDLLAGPVTVAVDDQVMARRDGTPAYNLVVVLDDDHQRIEQVVRGDDLLAATPRQARIAAAFGIRPPAYAHVPLVLGPTGVRLAKRDGAVTLDDRLALGETPEQVRSTLAWSAGLCARHDRPSVDELVASFDPASIRRTPWRLDAADLNGP